MQSIANSAASLDWGAGHEAGGRPSPNPGEAAKLHQHPSLPDSHRHCNYFCGAAYGRLQQNTAILLRNAIPNHRSKGMPRKISNLQQHISPPSMPWPPQAGHRKLRFPRPPQAGQRGEPTHQQTARSPHIIILSTQKHCSDLPRTANGTRNKRPLFTNNSIYKGLWKWKFNINHPFHASQTAQLVCGADAAERAGTLVAQTP